MAPPHGGRNALLPTNLYCIGIPGGAYGPVVLDVATSMLTGGWIYAAREAGLTLPVRPWRPGTISTAGRSYPKAGTWAMFLPRSWKSSAKPCRGRLPRAKSTGCCWRCIATVIVRRRPCGPPPKKSCRKFAPVHRRQALIGSKHPESGSATIGITAGRSGRFAHPCTDLGTNKGACLIRQTVALRLLPRVPRRHCSGRSRLGPGSRNRARSKTGRRCASVAATGRRW